MSASGLDVFDRTLETTHIWLNEICNDLGPDKQVAWKVLSTWEKPFLCAFSDGDAVTRGGDRAFQERIPGTKGQPHTTIVGAGHFLQEDRGPEVAAVISDFIAATPTTAR